MENKQKGPHEQEGPGETALIMIEPPELSAPVAPKMTDCTEKTVTCKNECQMKKAQGPKHTKAKQKSHGT